MSIMIQPFADFGTSTPWIARCMIEVFNIRDKAVTDLTLKRNFDEIYEIIIQNLLSSYKAKESLRNILNQFAENFHNGLNYTKEGDVIHINENIDGEINDLFSLFIIKLHTAVKDIQKGLKIFGYDIGFFYQNDKKYREGKLKFLEIHQYEDSFIDMLDNDKVRYKELAKIRDNYNHDSFKLEKVKYNCDKGLVFVPGELSNIETLRENSWKFIEDVTVMTFGSLLPDKLNIITIPGNLRDPDKPIKYIVDLV